MNANMVRELVKSLQYLHSAIQNQNPCHIPPAQAEKLLTVISRLASRKKIHPAVFGSYYQTVLTSMIGDSPEEFIDVMLVASEWPCEFTIQNFDAESYGDSRVPDIYRACLNTDPVISLPFLSPDPVAEKYTRQCISDALALMEKAIPHLAEEFYTLVHEIVLASSAKEKGEMRFDGASSYMLWGSLFLNVDEKKSPLEMMETLIHESSHGFLFGTCIEEALVKNEDVAIYHSPLRPDPRPMDGIYHATYVSARMHYAILEAIQSPLLDSAQREEADKLLQSSYRAFKNGYQVVESHGDLTQTGEELMREALKYMEQSSYGINPVAISH